MRKDHSTKLHILRSLSDGEFHSGEALGHDLGISRAAIAKHVKGLSEWGVDIYRIQGRGYQKQQLSLLGGNGCVFLRCNLLASVSAAGESVVSVATRFFSFIWAFLILFRHF